MIKKRVLFIIPSFGIGGTTVSTRNLISLLDINKYDLDVLSFTNRGPLKNTFFNCTIKNINPLLSLIMLSAKQEKKKYETLLVYLIGALRKSLSLINIDLNSILYNLVACSFAKEKYDTIIACQEGPSTELGSYFKVKNKISWVRSDYSRYGKLIGKKMVTKEKKTYEKYTWIVCVSDYTKEQFCLIHPEHLTKTLAIKNPQNANAITQKAAYIDNDFNVQKKSINLISVGRIDSVKRFHEIPEIAAKIKSENKDFRWFILGDGDSNEKARILQNIKNHNVENEVIYLGLKENPYPYIKDCDLFVCLSESEACPRVIDEAKILHTPSICTNFPSALEFIINGENGIICPLEEISNNIIMLLKDKYLYAKINHNIKLFDFENENILAKINNIL